MTDEEILSISVNAAHQTAKTLHQDKKLSGIHSLYGASIELAESISYHAVKGVFPEKLFKHQSPNETELESKYIRNNYKQHTLPVFLDYQMTITRPFGDGNWSIDYEEDPTEFKASKQTFQQYVENDLPVYKSLEQFVKFVLPTIKSIDANGFIAIRPKYIPTKVNEDNQLVIDSEVLYSPYPVYFESKQVMDFNDEYALFLSQETSDVEYGGKIEKTGLIFELYTKNAIYLIKQVNKKIEHKFEVFEFYRHDKGEIPVHQLMGVPNLVNNKILWQSPFSYATDVLDLVAVNKNWLQVSISKCVFPHVVMVGNECDFEDTDGNRCTSGKMLINGTQEKTCPQCNGTGLKSRMSRLGTILINPSSSFNDGEKLSTDPLKFVSPDVTTLEFIEKKSESDEAKARSILKLRNKNSQVQTTGDNTTATEISDDSKSMTAFVKPISDQIFSIYEFSLKWIGFIRYGEKFKQPTLTYPKTFDFKSPEDYLADVEEAMKNNLPPSFIQVILIQFINSFYSDNEATLSIFKLIIESDRLFGLTQNEINLKVAKQTVEKWEDILHTSALYFINDLMIKDQGFLKQDIEKQKEQLIQAAKDKSEEMDTAQVDIYQQPLNIAS